MVKLAVALLLVLLHTYIIFGATVSFRVSLDEDCIVVRNETECVCNCSQVEIIKYAYCDPSGRLFCSDTIIEDEEVEHPYFPTCICSKKGDFETHFNRDIQRPSVEYSEDHAEEDSISEWFNFPLEDFIEDYNDASGQYHEPQEVEEHGENHPESADASLHYDGNNAEDHAALEEVDTLGLAEYFVSLIDTENIPELSDWDFDDHPTDELPSEGESAEHDILDSETGESFAANVGKPPNPGSHTGVHSEVYDSEEHECPYKHDEHDEPHHNEAEHLEDPHDVHVAIVQEEEPENLPTPEIHPVQDGLYDNAYEGAIDGVLEIVKNIMVDIAHKEAAVTVECPESKATHPPSALAEAEAIPGVLPEQFGPAYGGAYDGVHDSVHEIVFGEEVEDAHIPSEDAAYEGAYDGAYDSVYGEKYHPKEVYPDNRETIYKDAYDGAYNGVHASAESLPVLHPVSHEVKEHEEEHTAQPELDPISEEQHEAEHAGSVATGEQGIVEESHAATEVDEHDAIDTDAHHVVGEYNKVEHHEEPAVPELQDAADEFLVEEHHETDEPAIAVADRPEEPKLGEEHSESHAEEQAAEKSHVVEEHDALGEHHEVDEPVLIDEHIMAVHHDYHLFNEYHADETIAPEELHAAEHPAAEEHHEVDEPLFIDAHHETEVEEHHEGEEPLLVEEHHETEEHTLVEEPSDYHLFNEYHVDEYINSGPSRDIPEINSVHTTNRKRSNYDDTDFGAHPFYETHPDFVPTGDFQSPVAPDFRASPVDIEATPPSESHLEIPDFGVIYPEDVLPKISEFDVIYPEDDELLGIPQFDVIYPEDEDEIAVDPVQENTFEFEFEAGPEDGYEHEFEHEYEKDGSFEWEFEHEWEFDGDNEYGFEHEHEQEGTIVGVADETPSLPEIVIAVNENITLPAVNDNITLPVEPLIPTLPAIPVPVEEEHENTDFVEPIPDIEPIEIFEPEVEEGPELPLVEALPVEEPFEAPLVEELPVDEHHEVPTVEELPFLGDLVVALPLEESPVPLPVEEPIVGESPEEEPLEGPLVDELPLREDPIIAPWEEPLVPVVDELELAPLSLEEPLEPIFEEPAPVIPSQEVAQGGKELLHLHEEEPLLPEEPLPEASIGAPLAGDIFLEEFLGDAELPSNNAPQSPYVSPFVSEDLAYEAHPEHPLEIIPHAVGEVIDGNGVEHPVLYRKKRCVV